jgi:hypothetical protein
MAIEMFVFSDRQLKSIAEWQTAIDAEGFPLKLKDVNFDKQSGFLPALLNGEPTGFECYHDLGDDFIREAEDLNFDRAWKFVLGFRWIGDFYEFQAAWMAGAAYAVATNGMVLDDEGGTFLGAVEAREEARKIVRDMPKLEAIMRELDATRPQRVQEFKARWSEKS